MFLFSCCTSGQTQFSYQVRQNHQKLNSVSWGNDLHEKINNSKKYVVKVKKSNHEELLKSNSNKKWTDPQFPPNKNSLGQIPEIPTCNWKRLSQLITKPILFTSNTNSSQTVKSNVIDCYFQSAVSSIVEDPKRIKDIFVTQQINQSGIYCVKIRFDGAVQQVIVDDYIPVNELGQPIFSTPSDSEIWLPLLEKAWAKINGSYANIINGNPAQVFKALNFAPSQIFFLQDKQQKKQKLWKLLTDAVNRKSPVSCLTSHNQQDQWIHLNLTPNHRYSLLYAAQVSHTDKKSYRIVKLRNPNSKANWTGKASASDGQFWGNILASEQKIKLVQNINQNQGQILMIYSDFVKYFIQIYISYQLQQGNFIWQDVFFNGKNGSLWQIQISHEGQYSFELHQQSLRNKTFFQQQKQYCRSTLLLAKVTQPKNYDYINGAMRFIEQDILVNATLKSGKYIIYAKIQGEKGKQGYSKKTSLSCYSNKLSKFKLIQKKACQNFLQNLFMNYGRQNKRQQYNRQKMWISWKLLFKECGFAYIAFGNAKDSDKEFIVKFQSKDFQSMHFKLKHPFKANKNGQNTFYQLKVSPGQQKIILARVINNRVTALKFPPPLEMKIQQINK